MHAVVFRTGGPGGKREAQRLTYHCRLEWRNLDAEVVRKLTLLASGFAGRDGV
jgi:hypothetical protein